MSDEPDQDDEAETLLLAMLSVADHAGSDEEAQAAIREIAEGMGEETDEETDDSDLHEAVIPRIDAPARYATPVEQLLAASMDQGSALLCKLAKAAVTRLAALPLHEIGRATRLFSDEELEALASELGAVRMSGDLLGRSLLKDHAARVKRKAAKLGESLQPGVSLDVPVVLQGTDYSCGRAALQSILDYHGVEADNVALGNALGTDPDDGTQPEALVAYVKSLGLPCEVRDHATTGDLADALRHDAPCLCCVQRDGVGHWVVVAGVNDGLLTVMDPMAGTGLIPEGEWIRSWWDTAGGKTYTRWALAIGPPPAQESRQTSKLHRLLEASGVPPLQPEAALDFFRKLVPTLGTDPHRLADGRRQAFTLAVATDLELLDAVKAAIEDFLRGGSPAPSVPSFSPLVLPPPNPPPLDTPKAIRTLLDAAGVTPASDAYATQVFRTNAMDSFNQGVHDEMQVERETFPTWQLSNPDDGRSRPTHAARNGRYYPAERSLASIRDARGYDGYSCRCVPIPVDKWTWEDLVAGGATWSVD